MLKSKSSFAEGVASSLIPHPALSGDQIHAHCTALHCNATRRIFTLYSTFNAGIHSNKKKYHYFSKAFLNETQQFSYR